MPGGEGTALTDALALLGRRDHFCRELQSKLVNRGHRAEDAEAAVDACVQRGWVDDAALAERFVQWRAVANGWGPHRLRLELKRRGVDEAVISAAVRIPAEVAEQALATAVRRAARRARTGWQHSGEGRSRMVSSLLRRGFDMEEARRAVDDLAEQLEERTDEG
jgi:regulatory protein